MDLLKLNLPCTLAGLSTINRLHKLRVTVKYSCLLMLLSDSCHNLSGLTADRTCQVTRW